MKRLIAIISFSLMFALLSMAIPAKRVKRTVVIDGVKTTLTLVGTEDYHYWKSSNGKAYRLNSDGSFSAIEASKNATSMAKARAIRKSDAVVKRVKQKTNNFVGNKKGLVILVNFKDNKFTFSDNPKTEYQRILSEKNYSGGINSGSVRDYFLAQSYGKFDFILDIAGPYTLSQKMEYYGENDLEGNDLRPGAMIYEACVAADKDVDFSQYDWDGDGYVDQLFVIYAGYGESSGAPENTIWPHAWSIYEAGYYEKNIDTERKYDGVLIDSYACGSELTGDTGHTVDGIGTICHEFSHCFGLPDFYCTDYSHESLCMDSWSVMDYGSYNGDGYTPAAYTAYERWACGWLEPTELSSPCYVKQMSDINDHGESYIIYNEGNRNEYYILQNIQKTGWNKHAPGHGMLVTHVDYNATEWKNNSVNVDENHLRMTPICADNKRTIPSLDSSGDLDGDTYPGTSGNTSLTDTSSPAASLFNKNADGTYFMGKPIEDITEQKGLINFTFMGGEVVDVPEGINVSNLTKKGFTISWNPIEGIENYDLKYGGIKEGDGTTLEEIFHEDFSKLAQETSDGSQDISGTLDEVLINKGFTGEKLYLGVDGLKMSSSKVNGNIISPLIETQQSEATITIKVKGYKNDASFIGVDILDKKGNSTNEVQNLVSIKGKDTTVVFKCNVPEEGFKVKIIAVKRCYLEDFIVCAPSSISMFNEKTISGITSTSYTLEPDFEADRYYFYLRAVKPNGKTSAWTSRFEQELLTAGINNVSTTANEIKVYSINGVLQSIMNEGSISKLPKGIYIVRSNNRTRKILVE